MDVKAEGEAGGLTARLLVNRIGAAPDYELRTRLERVDLTALSRHLPRVTDLTGEVRLRRTGDEIWRGEANIDVLNIEGLPRATGLSLRGSLRQGIVVLDTIGVRLSDGYGVVRGHARIDLGQFWNAGGRLPTYRAGVRVDGLAMGRFLRRPDLLEDVSLQIGLGGEGFHPDSARANADVIVEASRFLGGKLDSARASLVQQGRRTIVDRLFLAGTRAHVEGAGWIAPGDSLDLRARGRVGDFRMLDDVVGTELTGTPATFAGAHSRRVDETLRRGGSAGRQLEFQGYPDPGGSNSG